MIDEYIEPEEFPVNFTEFSQPVWGGIDSRVIALGVNRMEFYAFKESMELLSAECG